MPKIPPKKPKSPTKNDEITRLTTPGEMLAHLLKVARMTLVQLSERSKLPLDLLRRIMFGSARITPQVADMLSIHLGLAPSDWLTMQELMDDANNV